MDEEAAIRRIALTALRDHPTVSLREIYTQLTDGAVETNAAHHLRRQRIVQVLKRSLSLTPVYFDRKSQETLIWARRSTSTSQRAGQPGLALSPFADGRAAALPCRRTQP